MTQAQQTVLNIAAASLFGASAGIPKETDCQAVFDEIKKQNIVSLTYPVAKKLAMPEDVLKEWANENDKYLLNNARNIGSHLSIHKLMSEAGIPYVILKGVSSGSYYPDYLLRAYGDVDFLVSEEDYERAAKLLESRGFSYSSEHDKHKVYKKGRVTYELHRRIVGVPEGRMRPLVEGCLSDIIASAVPFKHGGSFCMIPTDRHNAVILLIHTAEHMGSSGLGVRHLMDWAAFAGSMTDEFFENEMQDALRRMGIWRYCSVLTSLCTKYLGLRQCGWAEDIDENYLNELIEDVFESGEFGHVYKAALEESGSGLAPTDKLGKIGAIGAFLALLNDRAKKLPAVGRFPMLRPFGWAFIGARYLARMAIGRRTFKMARNNAVRFAERRGLREEWQLFEPEDMV